MPHEEESLARTRRNRFVLLSSLRLCERLSSIDRNVGRKRTALAGLQGRRGPMTECGELQARTTVAGRRWRGAGNRRAAKKTRGHHQGMVARSKSASLSRKRTFEMITIVDSERSTQEKSVDNPVFSQRFSGNDRSPRRKPDGSAARAAGGKPKSTGHADR